MATLQAGSSTSVTLAQGGTISVSTNSGFATVTVTLDSGATTSANFGPLPSRQVFGPYDQGATVALVSQTADVIYKTTNQGSATTAGAVVDLVIFAGQSQSNSNGITGNDVPAGPLQLAMPMPRCGIRGAMSG